MCQSIIMSETLQCLLFSLLSFCSKPHYLLGFAGDKNENFDEIQHHTVKPAPISYRWREHIIIIIHGRMVDELD